MTQVKNELTHKNQKPNSGNGLLQNPVHPAHRRIIIETGSENINPCDRRGNSPVSTHLQNPICFCTTSLCWPPAAPPANHKSLKPPITARKVQPVRISHNPVTAHTGVRRLMPHSMGLIGTPNKWGSSTTTTGFACSSMINSSIKLRPLQCQSATHRAVIWRSRPANFPVTNSASDLVFQYRQRTQIFCCRPLHQQQRS